MGEQLDLLTIIEFYRQQLSDKILELAVANARIKALTEPTPITEETKE